MTKLTKDAYEDLIEGNLEWLSAQPMSLEHAHIELILRASTQHEYDDQERIAKLLAEVGRLRKALSDIMPIAKRGSVSADRWDEHNAAKDVLEGK